MRRRLRARRVLGRASRLLLEQLLGDVLERLVTENTQSALGRLVQPLDQGGRELNIKVFLTPEEYAVLSELPGTEASVVEELTDADELLSLFQARVPEVLSQLILAGIVESDPNVPDFLVPTALGSSALEEYERTIQPG